MSREKIKQAIPKSGGMVSAVCSKSGYTWAAVRDFIAADPELKQMMTDEESRIDDMAENTLLKKIANGDERVSMWWLARRRKAKFGDSVDLTSGGEKLEIIVRYDDSKRNPTDTA